MSSPRRNAWARRVFFFTDFILPWAEPVDPLSEENKLLKQLGQDEALAAKFEGGGGTTAHDAMEFCRGLLVAEENRRASVEARLGGIVGFGSVAAALAMGLLAIWSRSDLSDRSGSTTWATYGAMYSTAQLLFALGWAVRGLSRVTSSARRIADVLPKTDESAVTYARRRMTTYVQDAAEQQRIVDWKVTCMAVAQRALLNFIFGLVVVTIATGFASCGSTAARRSPERQRRGVMQPRAGAVSERRLETAARLDRRPPAKGVVRPGSYEGKSAEEFLGSFQNGQSTVRERTGILSES